MNAVTTRQQIIKVMKIDPYIIFNGNCEEALNFYAGVFGGNTGEISRYGDAPGFENATPAQKNKVMHAHFSADGIFFMASDTNDQAGSSTPGNMVHLSINFNDAGQQKNVFNKLSEGGNVVMPLQDTFWGATFAMLVDRYGIHWMLNYDKAK